MLPLNATESKLHVKVPIGNPGSLLFNFLYNKRVVWNIEICCKCETDEGIVSSSSI
jgi:hypothetical protein